MEDKKTIKVSLGTVICIFIIILLVIALGIMYYVGFVKNNIKEQNVQPNSYEQSSSKNNTNTVTSNNENNTITKVAYKEFAVAKSDDKTINYIIAKDEKNNWNEIIEKNQEILICGEYNNKLYYSDGDGLKYIDLNNSQFSETKWLNYKEYQAYDNGGMEKLAISKATMIDDTIYFEYNTSAGGVDSTDGIQTIKITDNSMDNAKQFIAKADMGKWEIDTDNKILYFIEFEHSTAGTLYKYNLVTNEQSKLFDKVVSFDVKSNKILYYIFNQTTTPNANGYYPATYDLYLYDLNSKENKLINSSKEGPLSGSLWSYAEYNNNDVYYKSGSSIIKYNNGKNDVIYTYSSSDGGEYLYGFQFVDENIIELVLQMADNKYIVDGKVVSSPTGISTITVKMINGSTKTFTANNIVK